MALFANAAPTLGDLLGYLRGGDVDFSYADLDISWFTSSKVGFAAATYPDGRNAFHDIAKNFLIEEPRAVRLMLEYYGYSCDEFGAKISSGLKLRHLEGIKKSDLSDETSDLLSVFYAEVGRRILVSSTLFAEKNKITFNGISGGSVEKFINVFYDLLSELKDKKLVSLEGGDD